MQEEHIIIGKILAKYPVLTEQEQSILNEWLSKEHNRERFNIIMDQATTVADVDMMRRIRARKETGREKYYAAIAQIDPKRKIAWWTRWQTYVAAACIIAIAGTFVYVLNSLNHNNGKQDEVMAVKMNDAAPGKFKAKLTLDDGTVVILDSAAKGKLAQQGSTYIMNEDGQLVYQHPASSPGGQEATKVLYNTLSTSRGETYATILADGSKVWLNSQSSIRYPVSFTGDMRQVEITGEAYFEVATAYTAGKAKRPFIVQAPGVQVEVLGTHFNVNAYTNENEVKTTLLEGKVKVSATNSKAIALLKPNQQATLDKQTNDILTLDNANVEEAVAWKNGYFQFNDDDIKTVFRQIVRWYDVEVVFEGNMPVRTYAGKIPRSSNLSQVLGTLETMEKLQTNQLHFRLEGKKIIVSP